MTRRILHAMPIWFRSPLIRGSAIATAVIICAFALLESDPITAHANQLDSSPQPSEELETPPERVIIWFTEPIEPAFSSITVFDSKGANITDGDTTFDATERTAMWVALSPLENGTYTVVWRNVSSVDGHKVTGSFLFAVGEPLGAGTLVAVEHQPLVQSPFDPVIRWVIYIGVAVFAGGLFFELLVANRFARSEDQHDVFAFAQQTSTRFATIALVSIIVVILAQFSQLAMQTAIAFDDALAAIDPTRIIDVLTQSDWGRFWSWRLTAAVLAALALFAAFQSRRTAARSLENNEPEDVPLTTETPFGIAAIALGGVYLLLIALTSHNAATPSDIRWFAIASDLVHIISATIWVGGIAFLLVASTRAIGSGQQYARNAFVQLATSFAPLAIFAAIILVASGIVSSLVQVTVAVALGTPYGGVLVIKILLLVILIVIADINLLTVSRGPRPTVSSTRFLPRCIAAELAVAFTVLLASAGLASLEPARQYAERNGIGVIDYLSRSETISGADIYVKLDPGTTGANTLTVDITDDDGAPFSHANEVRARLKYLQDEFGEQLIPLDNPSPGQWQLEDITIGIAGAYQLDVAIIRSDSFDSFVSTRFLAESPIFPSDFFRPSAQSVMFVFGILIAVVGFAFIATTSVSKDPIRVNLKPIHSIAILPVAIGIAVILNAFTTGIGIPDDSKGNPFPLSQESVQIGLETYATSCATCHGDTGLGDGPAGLALNPPPADLAVHVPLHTDNELYGFIADGIEGTPMVAQLGNLTTDEIWHLVNYIRTISQ